MDSILLSPKIVLLFNNHGTSRFVLLNFYVSVRFLAGQSYAVTWKQRPELHVAMVLIALHLMVRTSHKILHLS
jgi:hypothetical protein